ncbi:helix-turn-helix transcriptional regulator [Deinococcus sp.]|uniref:helix-turn-helix domain-containing protein n=1 Tax=Deinococcus sp. TaxID=47478 RepID=UPI0025EE372C|nr:helix-turn-helix transcriptional regulator [Deinococcus sp.]
MNDELRAVVNARLKTKGMSRADLARATGKHPNAISRALNGGKDSGSPPPVWAAMLEALDLRLTAEVLPGEGEQ